MRQERTSVSFLNAGILPNIGHSSDTDLWGGWALEMRRILRKLSKQFLQSRKLVWSHCTREFVRLIGLYFDEDKRRGKKRRKGRIVRTLGRVDFAHIHHPWTDAKEEHAVFLVLSIELGRHKVHGPLGDGVQSSCIEFELVAHVEVRHPAAYTYDLLNLALEDKWHEQIVEVNVANDVDVHQFVQVLLQALGVFASV